MDTLSEIELFPTPPPHPSLPYQFGFVLLNDKVALTNTEVTMQGGTGNGRTER